MNTLAPAGPLAQAVADMAWVLIAGASVIFLAMMGLLAFTLRRPPGGQAAPVDGARSDRRWLVLGGLVLPALVLLPLLAYTASTSLAWMPAQWQAAGAGPGGPRWVVSVTGRMWWWEVHYRDAASGRVVALANEVRLPVGQPVVLGLNSADVIHSFWVPQLAGKVDMVPGRVHQLVLQADEPGIYRGQCAEFCGEQHARMALHVIALPPGQFEAWLQTQASDAVPPRAGSPEARGQAVFTQQRCNACHAVRGLPGGGAAPPGMAPDLTHVGGRLHLGAGTLPMSTDHLQAWVAHTQRLKPGARMPQHAQMDQASLRALAAYLASLE